MRARSAARYFARKYLLSLPVAVIFTARHWQEITALRSGHGMTSPGWVFGVYGLMDTLDVVLFAAAAVIALALTFRHRLPTDRLRSLEVA